MLGLTAPHVLKDPVTGQLDEPHFNEVQQRILGFGHDTTRIGIPCKTIRLAFDVNDYTDENDYSINARMANELAAQGIQMVLRLPLRIRKPDGSIGRVESQEEVKQQLERITATHCIDRDLIWRISANEPENAGPIADGKGYTCEQYLEVMYWYCAALGWPEEELLHNPPWTALTSMMAGNPNEWASLINPMKWAREVDFHLYHRYDMHSADEDARYAAAFDSKLQALKWLVDTVPYVRPVFGEANVWAKAGDDDQAYRGPHNWMLPALMRRAALLQTTYIISGELDHHQAWSVHEWGLWVRNNNRPWCENPILVLIERGWHEFVDVATNLDMLSKTFEDASTSVERAMKEHKEDIGMVPGKDCNDD